MLQNLSTWQKVAIAVTVPASVGLLYLLFKNRDDDDEYYERPQRKEFVIKQEITVEIVVPRDKVGGVIGKGGCVINKIRDETGAKLNFSDHSREGDAPRVLKITGKPSSALEAEQRIHELLSAPGPQSVEILIPIKAIGRIVGKGGANIRSICRGSGARVRIARAEDTPPDQNFRVCTIRGTPEEIARAKAMVEEEIALEEERSQRLKNASENRMRRSPEKNKASLPVAQLEQVRFPSHGDYFTVFVSAVEHPGHFWMQIVSDKGPELDLMVEDMTEYYSQVRNRESHVPETLCTGDIVAAPFEHDSAWYRAKIVGFLGEDKVDMYFVDYGDYGAISRNDLFKLRADFLSLPFQAIECSLASVEPLDMKWKEEGIDAFDDLSHCAQWQPLMARMMGYKSLHGKTLPCVDLVDTSSEEDINIAAELIKGGFARDTRVSSARKVTGDNKMRPEEDTRPGLVEAAYVEGMDDSGQSSDEYVTS